MKCLISICKSDFGELKYTYIQKVLFTDSILTILINKVFLVLLLQLTRDRKTFT